MLSIVIIGLFSFIFLGTEYIFDNTMAYFTTPSGVVTAQNFILGASVIGFVLYPFVKKWVDFTKKIYSYLSLSIVILCIYVLYIHPSYEILMSFSLICYVIFGMWGSHIYYLAAREWNRGIHIARNVGIAYAIGIVIQFVNNNVVKNIPAQLMVTVCLVILMLFLMRREENRLVKENRKELNNKVLLSIKSPKKAGMLLIVIVALMAIVFSSIDNLVTLEHLDGTYDIGQLPRILLAVSGLIAGLFFDICKRKYMYLSMYCITLLSVISIVLMKFGEVFIPGLIVFYLSAGFFVVFFVTSFIDLSYECKRPVLWAGLGRAVNNACAILTSVVAVFLYQKHNEILIMILFLILLVGITACIFFYTTKVLESANEKNCVSTEQNNNEKKFVVFCNTYGFTNRECDVMHALLKNDMKMQDIASMLYISRTALYRHVAKLNEKTKTNNRISLIQFYHHWEG